MKLGIFGGTFDPVHKGHVKCAETIKQEFDLDKVIFVPTGNPMHKIFSRVVPGKMRIEMIKLAIDGLDGLEVSDIEVKRHGYTYTIDTLNELSDTGDELYYIVGTDVLDSMEKWKDFDKIVKLCKFIAVRRPGCNDSLFDEALEKERKLGAEILVSNSGGLTEASSTDARNFAETEKLSDVVPEKVAEYIRENNLYDESSQVPEKQIMIDLEEILSDEKYHHSLGVSKEAARLAEIYGADREKCRLAGLLHDCAKNVTVPQLEKWFDMSLEDFGNGEPFNGVNRRVIHGPVGRIVAEKRFGVKDNVVLDAIAQHVTGKPEMSLESAIVFISDYTEENREGEVFDIIRDVLENEGLYPAIVKACDLTTELIIKRKEQMDVQMVYTRNWAITKIGE